MSASSGGKEVRPGAAVEARGGKVPARGLDAPSRAPRAYHAREGPPISGAGARRPTRRRSARAPGERRRREAARRRVARARPARRGGRHRIDTESAQTRASATGIVVGGRRVALDPTPWVGHALEAGGFSAPVGFRALGSAHAESGRGPAHRPTGRHPEQRRRPSRVRSRRLPATAPLRASTPEAPARI
jgi:hypothetical protein